MTHAQLVRQVARATGESPCTIADRGFNLVTDVPEFDLEPSPRKPQTVDWDDLDARRTAFFPQRRRRPAQVA
jgi:hypothetical protein